MYEQRVGEITQTQIYPCGVGQDAVSVGQENLAAGSVDSGSPGNFCPSADSVGSEKLCACGNPLRVIQWKKKTKVLAKNGKFSTVSKNMTSLRCLDCPAKNSGLEADAPRIPQSRKGGGALQQKRLGDFWK